MQNRMWQPQDRERKHCIDMNLFIPKLPTSHQKTNRQDGSQVTDLSNSLVGTGEVSRRGTDGWPPHEVRYPNGRGWGIGLRSTSNDITILNVTSIIPKNESKVAWLNIFTDFCFCSISQPHPQYGGLASQLTYKGPLAAGAQMARWMVEGKGGPTCRKATNGFSRKIR